MAPVSNAVKNFVREGPVKDVVVSPTVPFVYVLTVENRYKAPVKILSSLFRDDHGLFGLILAALLAPVILNNWSKRRKSNQRTQMSSAS